MAILYTVAYTIPARPEKFTRYCLTRLIPKLYLVRQYLGNVDVFGMEGLKTSEMTVKLKRNIDVGPVDIFYII